MHMNLSRYKKEYKRACRLLKRLVKQSKKGQATDDVYQSIIACNSLRCHLAKLIGVEI